MEAPPPERERAAPPTSSESKTVSVSSQSAMLLKAAQLVAQLQQQASFDTGALLGELIEGAAASVPGAQYAGITVAKRRHPSETAAATHSYPVLLDKIQNRYQQGPCLSAAAQQESVRIDDLGADQRWPHRSTVNRRSNKPRFDRSSRSGCSAMARPLRR
jgi:hypothetical protein